MISEEKLKLYLLNKDKIQTGDILFTRGSSFLARSIQKIDKCYFNHCGIIFREGDYWFVLESLNEGGTASFLEKRIRLNEDFTIYRPMGIYRNEKLRSLIHQVITCKVGEKYDRWLLVKIALARLLKNKKWFRKDNKVNSDICSELVRRYTDMLGLTKFSSYRMEFSTGSEWITPADFLRYNERELIKII